jgi:hypothetical protein
MTPRSPTPGAALWAQKLRLQDAHLLQRIEDIEDQTRSYKEVEQTKNKLLQQSLNRMEQSNMRLTEDHDIVLKELQSMKTLLEAHEKFEDWKAASTARSDEQDKALEKMRGDIARFTQGVLDQNERTSKENQANTERIEALGRGRREDHKEFKAALSEMQDPRHLRMIVDRLEKLERSHQTLLERVHIDKSEKGKEQHGPRVKIC